jgi:single-strand DNA-binding protein
MARSLNRVELIGNLTRDPELRYTPQGTAVCTLGIATNRTWQTESGEKKEDVEYHRVIAWNKLAELCSQLLTKGRKVYVEGRLQTRSWTAQDGAQKSLTEIVINDMLILDSKRSTDTAEGVDDTHGEESSQDEPAVKPEKKKSAAPAVTEEINPDDIPF